MTYVCHTKLTKAKQKQSYKAKAKSKAKLSKAIKRKLILLFIFIFILFLRARVAFLSPYKHKVTKKRKVSKQKCYRMSHKVTKLKVKTLSLIHFFA